MRAPRLGGRFIQIWTLALFVQPPALSTHVGNAARKSLFLGLAQLNRVAGLHGVELPVAVAVLGAIAGKLIFKVAHCSSQLALALVEPTSGLCADVTTKVDH